MKKTILYTVIFIIGDILLILLLGFIGQFFVSGGDYSFDTLIFTGVTYIVCLFIQAIVGAILLNNQARKQIGAGLLIASGTILLIGLSVCSGIWR
jgi:hypothetical protein